MVSQMVPLLIYSKDIEFLKKYIFQGHSIQTKWYSIYARILFIEYFPSVLRKKITCAFVVQKNSGKRTPQDPEMD